MADRRIGGGSYNQLYWSETLTCPEPDLFFPGIRPEISRYKHSEVCGLGDFKGLFCAEGAKNVILKAILKIWYPSSGNKLFLYPEKKVWARRRKMSSGCVRETGIYQYDAM